MDIAKLRGDCQSGLRDRRIRTSVSPMHGSKIKDKGKRGNDLLEENKRNEAGGKNTVGLVKSPKRRPLPNFRPKKNEWGSAVPKEIP